MSSDLHTLASSHAKTSLGAKKIPNSERGNTLEKNKYSANIAAEQKGRAMRQRGRAAR